jgi:hypothetical protein
MIAAVTGGAAVAILVLGRALGPVLDDHVQPVAA